MKKMYVTMTLTVLLLIAGACSKDVTNDNSSGGDQILNKGNYTFLKSTAIYNDAKENRSEDYSAPFEITKVEKIDNTLNITVSFLKGCKVSKFDVIWNGIILQTYPQIIGLIVKRTADNCVTSEDTETQVLSIDLIECIGDTSLVNDASIIVSNASKKPDTSNADITISNKN